MNIEAKELRIIFQNALSHATQIAMHNGKREDRTIDVEEVIQIAKEIAKQVVMIGFKGKE